MGLYTGLSASGNPGINWPASPVAACIAYTLLSSVCVLSLLRSFAVNVSQENWTGLKIALACAFHIISHWVAECLGPLCGVNPCRQEWNLTGEIIKNTLKDCSLLVKFIWLFHSNICKMFPKIMLICCTLHHTPCADVSDGLPQGFDWSHITCCRTHNTHTVRSSSSNKVYRTDSTVCNHN